MIIAYLSERDTYSEESGQMLGVENEYDLNNLMHYLTWASWFRIKLVVFNFLIKNRQLSQ
jgi:hypothetical protein